jgi:hypothetical protein
MFEISTKLSFFCAQYDSLEKGFLLFQTRKQNTGRLKITENAFSKIFLDIFFRNFFKIRTSAIDLYVHNTAEVRTLLQLHMLTSES